MNKSLSVLLFAALFAISCSKSSDTATPEPVKAEPTVLLTKVTNVTPNSQDNGKVQAQFIYNGKQLVQADINQQVNGSFSESHYFIYNAQGQLTNSSITHPSANANNPLTATASYSGNTITNVKFFKVGNVLQSDHTFTYTDGKLTKWYDPSQVEIVYSYNSTGNNNKQVMNEYTAGRPNGYTITTDYLTFDSKHNVTTALPIWTYFLASGINWNVDVPGINNVLTAKSGTSNETYTYEYNSNGYPTKVTMFSAGSVYRIFTYEYKVVE